MRQAKYEKKMMAHKHEQEAFARQQTQNVQSGLGCPEKYTQAHVCPKKFYALMGVDEVDEDQPVYDDTNVDDDGENMAICGDVSRVLVLSPKIKPRSIRLHIRINGSTASTLIDGGNTHNFIQPAVEEKLSLPGHRFEIDLFILQVKGPDIILGVQWLQDLGDITKNYRNLTMKFEWNDQPMFLRGEDAPPRPISYNNLFSLIGMELEADVFELVTVQPDSPTPPSVTAETDSDITAILSDFTSSPPGALVALPPELLHGLPLDTPVRAVEERTVLVDAPKSVHSGRTRHPPRKVAGQRLPIVEDEGGQGGGWSRGHAEYSAGTRLSAKGGGGGWGSYCTVPTRRGRT
ncbi:hypothetical protein SASPL_100868 [Salvia splendens]|uniref:Uncharacterized protein n=1 Tax=Salvia splendens TaxID=180675 RepID=A0A8X9ABD1_SALSN|nr:hypothetical protein SASPL_100868 [Salvia splendens]